MPKFFQFSALDAKIAKEHLKEKKGAYKVRRKEQKLQNSYVRFPNDQIYVVAGAGQQLGAGSFSKVKRAILIKDQQVSQQELSDQYIIKVTAMSEEKFQALRVAITQARLFSEKSILGIDMSYVTDDIFSNHS